MLIHDKEIINQDLIQQAEKLENVLQEKTNNYKLELLKEGDEIKKNEQINILETTVNDKLENIQLLLNEYLNNLSKFSDNEELLKDLDIKIGEAEFMLK